MPPERKINLPRSRGEKEVAIAHLEVNPQDVVLSTTIKSSIDKAEEEIEDLFNYKFTGIISGLAEKKPRFRFGPLSSTQRTLVISPHGKDQLLREEEEFFEALRESPMGKTLQALSESADGAIKSIRQMEDAGREFLRYSYPTALLMTEEQFEAIVPTEESFGFLWGLVSQKKTKPFHAWGRRTTEREELFPVGPFLPKEMLKEQVREITNTTADFSKYLASAVELSSKISRPPEEIRDKRLEFATRVLNETLAWIAKNPAHPDAGYKCILFLTAVRKIRTSIEEDLTPKEWYKQTASTRIWDILHGTGRLRSNRPSPVWSLLDKEEFDIKFNRRHDLVALVKSLPAPKS